MARRFTLLLKQQIPASALTGLMFIRASAVHGLSGLQCVIKKCLSCLAFNAGRSRLASLNMLTDMPYRFIGFTKCGSHANTSWIAQ